MAKPKTAKELLEEDPVVKEFREQQPPENLPAGPDQMDLQVAREPSIVLAEAHRAAKALKDVIDKKERKVVMNGKTYLEFEDWQMIAKFYGITAKVVSTTPITMGTVTGFESTAAAYHLASGQEISRADAMCLNDEPKWSARPKYEYVYVLNDGTHSIENPPPNLITWIPNPNKPGKSMPKKERRLVGEEAVPLFQLRSMAQTRACAKALRNCLSWVVVLAGYAGTPAEEIEHREEPVHLDAERQGYYTPPKDEPPPPDDDFSWEKAKQQSEPAGTTEVKGNLGMFKQEDKQPPKKELPKKAEKELSDAVKAFKTAVDEYIANHKLGKMTKEEAERYIIKHCTMIEAQFDKETKKQIVKAHPGVDTYEAMSDKLAQFALKQLKAAEENPA